LTAVVFLILLPAVVIITATWAWRYQVRSLQLLRGRDPGTVDWAEARLGRVELTERDCAALTLEPVDNDGLRVEMLVAVDVPSPALTTLQAWHDAQVLLYVIIPAGRRIVRFRSVTTAEALTLRRVEA
jgi:hypothetical protein